ncbi:MAG: DsbA family protein [Actinomycetota bacterium]|nr:DsbA family protein [Actinomycetota bacterium]
MEAVAAQRGRRRGRWMVLALLALAATVLVAGIVSLSTQKPDRNQVRLDGIGDAQEIFGGVQQDGDRLGSPDASVSIQLFDDLQCSSCQDQFLSTIPTLVESYVRPGDLRMEYRHYSFSPSTEELGFFGAEAAADQGYAWPYVYLFFRNQDEAKRVGVSEDFLTAIAGAIPELDVPQWRDYLANDTNQIKNRLAGYEKLATDLSIRAQPAAIVNGPNGTRTLQDSPTLSQITSAIGAVR